MVRIIAAALAATTFAVTVNSHAQAPKYPEYHKTWQDGALRKPLKKELKAKTLRPSTLHGRAKALKSRQSSQKGREVRAGDILIERWQRSSSRGKGLKAK